MELIIRRESSDENTFAMVSFDKTRLVYDEDSLKTSVKRALVYWIQNTEAGKKAWENSRKNFNIGDLINGLGDEDLQKALTHQGVVGLKINVISGSSGTWEFDDILYQDN